MRCDDVYLMPRADCRLGEPSDKGTGGIVGESRIVMGGDEDAHRTWGWRKLAVQNARATFVESSGNGAGSRHSKIGIGNEGDDAGRDLEYGEPET
jgi:hypothetical protein